VRVKTIQGSSEVKDEENDERPPIVGREGDGNNDNGISY